MLLVASSRESIAPHSTAIPTHEEKPPSAETFIRETGLRPRDQARQRTIRPREVRIGGHREPVRASVEIPIVVANWIIAQGRPLRRIENFLHQADTGFTAAAQTKKLNNGWFIEVGESRQRLYQRARQLLDESGLRNVSFQVLLEDGTTKHF